MTNKRVKQSAFPRGIAPEVQKHLFEKKGIEVNLRKIQRILAGTSNDELGIFSTALRLTKKRLEQKNLRFKSLVVLKLTTKTK